MVSATARPYIDASVPVLREHGPTITQTFYRNMFAAHPELTNLFNMGNQASGVQQQSLAAAVFAYAANIDNAAALAPVVKRIVHKHASVGIRADHYPIVGFYLLGAIKEVLGDGATPSLIDAWSEAYSELAGALIDAENGLYAEAAITPGQLREMRVIDVSNESNSIKAIVMEAGDGKPVPPFKPGQYVSVSVTFSDGSTQSRQYSLSDAPYPDRLRISVKRETNDHAQLNGRVSNWLHDNVSPGCSLHISHPFGDFTPDAESDAPIVLLSAGVGITPTISVLNHIAGKNPARHVVFGHAARSKACQPHRADIEAARTKMPNLHVATFYEDLPIDHGNDGTIHIGRMDLARLPQWDRTGTAVYLCGPVPFMQEQWRELMDAGVPANRLHREVFGPELLNYLN